MMRTGWRLPFGANLIGHDRTQFRIWAPAQRTMSVAVEGAAPLPMSRSDDGWFEAEANCGAGARYRYILPDDATVPDPAARAQHGDVRGASIVVDPLSYRWRHPDWRGRPWHEAVLYEAHAGLLGGFAGVARELPRLAALGGTAVELMPVAEFPGGRNWGYDGALLFAPESSYGSPDDLRALIDAAHGHGLMMFLDVVYNHFGPEGNYLARYAPAMFRDDVATPWGPALNFRRREVRRFFTENALYWLLEYRFDGLRFDAVHAIADAGWLDEMAAEVRKSVEPGRHVHLVLENDDNSAAHLARGFDAQWNDDSHHVLHVLLTGESEGYYEDYADRPAERLARCLKEGFIYQGEPSAYRGGKSRGTASADLPPTAFVLFLQNHDQIGNRAFGERLTQLAHPQALEAAIALLCSVRKSRFCSWARKERVRRRSCSSPSTPRNWRRPYATAGAASLRSSRNFPIQSISTKFPIRTPPSPSSVPSRSLIPPGQGPANGFTATCWRCAVPRLSHALPGRVPSMPARSALPP
jgi:maltooligosyltrehalose trehalohydrolase